MYVLVLRVGRGQRVRGVRKIPKKADKSGGNVDSPFIRMCDKTLRATVGGRRVGSCF